MLLNIQIYRCIELGWPKRLQEIMAKGNELNNTKDHSSSKEDKMYIVEFEGSSLS